MSPKKRNKENRKLPARWRQRYGAYYYMVPKDARHHWDNKTEFRLGKTLAEAHQTFAERVGYEGKVTSMAHLCDRYALEVLPKKAKATQRSNQYSLARIRQKLGHNPVKAMRPRVLYEYQDLMIREESVKKAALDHEVLSHLFTCAIRWGVIDHHPMTNKGVVKPATGRRTVLPTLDDITALASIMPEKWQLYIALKVWTGRRKGELLRVKKSDLLDEGIRFVDNKNPDNVFILAWEPEIRSIVDRILRLPGAVRGLYLFSNRSGRPYIREDGNTSGFDSIWARYRNRAYDNGLIGVRFTEHDMRKVRPSQLSAEQAQELLQHTNAKQTQTYRPRKVVALGEHK